MKQLEMCQYETDAHAQSPSSLRNKHYARRAVKARMKQGIQKSWKNKVCIKCIREITPDGWKDERMDRWVPGQSSTDLQTTVTLKISKPVTLTFRHILKTKKLYVPASCLLWGQNNSMISKPQILHNFSLTRSFVVSKTTPKQPILYEKIAQPSETKWNLPPTSWRLGVSVMDCDVTISTVLVCTSGDDVFIVGEDIKADGAETAFSMDAVPGISFWLVTVAGKDFWTGKWALDNKAENINNFTVQSMHIWATQALLYLSHVRDSSGESAHLSHQNPATAHWAYM